MRLLKQVIEKKMDNERFLIKTSQDVLSYQEHISVYLLSLAYLGVEDKLIQEKALLWKKFVKTSNNKFFLKLLTYRPAEDYIILQAIKKMDLAREEQSEKWSSLFGDFAWAILSYEHQEEI